MDSTGTPQRVETRFHRFTAEESIEVTTGRQIILTYLSMFGQEKKSNPLIGSPINKLFTCGEEEMVER